MNTEQQDLLIAKMVKLTQERDELLATGTAADYKKAMKIDSVIVDHLFDDLDTDGYISYLDACGAKVSN